MIDFVSFVQRDSSEQKHWDFTANISGSLFDLPGGPLGVAAGVEYRKLKGRFDPDPVIVRDAFDWLLLERRCCPFLQLELSFDPSNGPVWLRFRGGPGVKEFLAAAGFKAR